LSSRLQVYFETYSDADDSSALLGFFDHSLGEVGNDIREVALVSVDRVGGASL